MFGARPPRLCVVFRFECVIVRGRVRTALASALSPPHVVGQRFSGGAWRFVRSVWVRGGFCVCGLARRGGVGCPCHHHQLLRVHALCSYPLTQTKFDLGPAQTKFGLGGIECHFELGGNESQRARSYLAVLRLWHVSHNDWWLAVSQNKS